MEPSTLQVYGACAVLDWKSAANVGKHLLRVCATRDRDVITGSVTRTVIGCHVT